MRNRDVHVRMCPCAPCARVRVPCAGVRVHLVQMCPCAHWEGRKEKDQGRRGKESLVPCNREARGQRNCVLLGVGWGGNLAVFVL